MFKSLKGIFNSNNKDLRKRIYFTLLVLAIFGLGTNIIVPGAKQITQNLSFLDLLNLMSGGSLKTFSIFALGVMPYITASILTQLLQMDILPYFKELKDQGATGRQKINRINRYLGILFAFVQGYIYSVAFMGGTTVEIIKTTIILTAGTALLLWLADQITNKGLGNGVSLFIMAGIVNTLPSTFITAFKDLVVADSFTKVLGIILFVSFIIAYLLILIGVVYMQISERRIPIQHSTRTDSSFSKEQSYIPLKLNSASVMPVIFASAITSVPSLIGGLINKPAFTNFVDNYIVYTSFTGYILYIVLIFLFGYVYTLMELNPKEMSENLDKNRSYIPGITPGEKTAAYLKGTISRLTVVGSIFLIIIASIPLLFSKISSLSSAVTLGGTGLLIVVGVALETYKQLESSIVSRSYQGSRKRRHRR
ncbi:MAG: preprotein translocase subunit SecY [Erysipelotrichales bacterium]|nr:preprotein translocase subunit SecY [Erysipelotrichales bacterium]